MPNEATQKFEIRLAPREGKPDPVVIDDILRLIQQAVVAAPLQIETPTANGKFIKLQDTAGTPAIELDSKIKHRIEQASMESQTLVEARAAKATLPDSESLLAQESLDAAANLVAAVQRAMIRGLRVSTPETHG